MAVNTLKAGAIDFLQKPVDDQRLLKTIENAVSHNLAQRRGKREVTDFRNRLESLTQREREVIRMVAQGYSNKEVAREYGISEKTVQVHRGSAYRKLDLHNAAEIARLLMLTGDPLSGTRRSDGNFASCPHARKYLRFSSTRPSFLRHTLSIPPSGRQETLR